MDPSPNKVSSPSSALSPTPLEPGNPLQEDSSGSAATSTSTSSAPSGLARQDQLTAVSVPVITQDEADHPRNTSKPTTREIPGIARRPAPPALLTPISPTANSPGSQHSARGSVGGILLDESIVPFDDRYPARRASHRRATSVVEHRTLSEEGQRSRPITLDDSELRRLSSTGAPGGTVKISEHPRGPPKAEGRARSPPHVSPIQNVEGAYSVPMPSPTMSPGSGTSGNNFEMGTGHNWNVAPHTLMANLPSPSPHGEQVHVYNGMPMPSVDPALRRPPINPGGRKSWPFVTMPPPDFGMNPNMDWETNDMRARALMSQPSFQVGYDWDIPHTSTARLADRRRRADDHTAAQAGPENVPLATPGRSFWERFVNALLYVGSGRRTHTNRQSITTSPNWALDRTVKGRLQDTLTHAENERDRYTHQAKRASYALNIAIGAQVVLGAFTTGIAASTSGRQAAIVTAVLGGMFTIAASYLARMRGSGEPEASLLKCRDLDNFIRNCEAFMFDYGHIVLTEHGADAVSLEKYIGRFRTWYETVLGNEMGGAGGQGQMQMTRQGPMGFPRTPNV